MILIECEVNLAIGYLIFNMTEQKFPQAEVEENALKYLKMTSWMKRGPLSSDLNERGRDYLLAVGLLEQRPDATVNLTLLSKLFDDEMSTTSTRIKSMESEGYLKISQYSADARGKVIKLTEKGKREYTNLSLGLYDISRRELPVLDGPIPSFFV